MQSPEKVPNRGFRSGANALSLGYGRAPCPVDEEYEFTAEERIEAIARSKDEDQAAGRGRDEGGEEGATWKKGRSGAQDQKTAPQIDETLGR